MSKKVIAIVVVIGLAALTLYQDCACGAEGQRAAAFEKPHPNAASISVAGKLSSWTILPMAKEDTCRRIRTFQELTRSES